MSKKGVADRAYANLPPDLKAWLFQHRRDFTAYLLALSDPTSRLYCGARTATHGWRR